MIAPRRRRRGDLAGTARRRPRRTRVDSPRPGARTLVEPPPAASAAGAAAAGADRGARRAAPGSSTRRCGGCPEGFTVHPKLERAPRAPRARPWTSRTRADDRLGHRRGAGVRLHPGRRHPHPPDRRGRRARHLQPAPRRLARRRDRRDAHAAAGAAPGAGRVRDPQQPALRERGPRLRVRLQRAGARRLVLWEAQYGDFINGAQVDHRRVRRSRPAPSGARRPSLVLLLPHGYEGQGPDHSQRAARALPAARRRHQPARRQLHDRRAVLPPAAPAGRAAGQRSAAPGRADAQEPAAPPRARRRPARAGRGPLATRP